MKPADASRRSSEKDKEIAYFLLRITLGVNMLIHGGSRLFGSYVKFIEDIKVQFSTTFLPMWSVAGFLSAVPFVEFALGLLLIVGFATRWTCIIGMLLMINLVFGMGLLQKWDVVGLQMNYVLFYFLVLYFSDWNRYSVDGWRSARLALD